MAAPLNDITKAFLQAVSEQGTYKPYSEVTIPEAREISKANARYFSREVLFEGETDEVNVPSANVPAGIPVSVYKPSGLGEQPAILVYFHGGGWVVGCRESYRDICQQIAKAAECIVLNVEYRLSPEHKFPACNDDARDVVQWVLENRVRVGGHTESVVGVGGDSGGGQIAATVCYEVPGIAFQVLVYPKVDTRMDRPSYKQYPEGPVLPRSLIVWFFQQWLSPDNYDDVRACPMLREIKSALPPALFVIAECDPIRDDSYDYEKKLRESGVETRTLLVNGLCHAFFGHPGHFVNACNESVVAIADFIKTYSKSGS